MPLDAGKPGATNFTFAYCHVYRCTFPLKERKKLMNNLEQKASDWILGLQEQLRRPKPPKNKRVAIYLNLYESGMSITQIADRYALAPRSVWRLLKRQGIDARSVHLPVRRKDTGETYPNLALASAATGISQSGISKACITGKSCKGIQWERISGRNCKTS